MTCSIPEQVYRGLLSRNAHLITSIYSKGLKQKKSTRAGFQNLLMQLRKTLGHPYLYDPEIEPSDVTSSQVQESLVEGSAKLVFLRKFIPKLLARGHRMLIFSQCRDFFITFIQLFFPPWLHVCLTRPLSVLWVPSSHHVFGCHGTISWWWKDGVSASCLSLDLFSFSILHQGVRALSWLKPSSFLGRNYFTIGQTDANRPFQSQELELQYLLALD